MFTRNFKVGERVKKTMLCASMALLLFMCFYFAPVVAHAQTPSGTLQTAEVLPTQLAGYTGLGTTDIRIIIANIIRVALGLLGLILLVLVLYGGYMYMTAGGNEEQIGQAKKILMNAVIGLIIILSAYGIVTFVLRALGLGGPGIGAGIIAPNSVNFQGSGALGGIVKDHYPARNQIDVARNTKIFVTFRKPIKLETAFINDINSTHNTNAGGNKLGDCTNIGQTMNWLTDCDALILSDDYINIRRADTGQQISGANIIASYEDDKVYTIVIRPYEYLGNSVDKVAYVVYLGKNLHLDDPANNNPPAFNVGVLGNNYYAWQFTCSTELDTSPPTVNNVFPGAGVTEVKNSVIQIDFSEAVDPIGVQGRFTTSSNVFVIGNSNIALMSTHSSLPSGSFKLTNNYQTLEFTPDVACGQNACGGTVYCLPVCDEETGSSQCTKNSAGYKQDNYEMLARAALTFNASSFEAIPFTGVEDASGNALDSSPYSEVNTATTTLPIFPTWKQPDNYFWNFKIIDQIDLTSPIVKQISPGLDKQFVGAGDLWKILFNKRMRVDPLYDIGIVEQPTPAQRGDNIPICKVPHAFFTQDGSTEARISHCPFLTGRRQYYFPVVSSSVEDAHFNCLYPGEGPGGDSAAIQKANGGLSDSEICDADHPGNCCNVTSTPESQALCCNGTMDEANASTSPACVSYLRANSP